MSTQVSHSGARTLAAALLGHVWYMYGNVALSGWVMLLAVAMALLLRCAARLRWPLGSMNTAAWWRRNDAGDGGDVLSAPASRGRRCMAVPLLNSEGCCSALRTARITCSGFMACTCGCVTAHTHAQIALPNSIDDPRSVQHEVSLPSWAPDNEAGLCMQRATSQ